MKNTFLFGAAGAVMFAAAMVSCGDKEQSEAAGCDATQAVIENIMTRTSVRQFTSEPIGADTLESIVKAGMAAPTAKNKQPWGFIVVTERAVLDSIDSVHPWANLKTATAAVVVCGDMRKTDDDGSRAYWVQDCSAATENILLAAHAYGLGAVWCGVYPTQERVEGVTRVLELPEGIIPLNVITMGHPAGVNQPKDKWLPENVHYQKW